MNLNLQQIKSITLGAVSITKEENGFHFYRFTQEQMNLYRRVSEDFSKKTQSTSGVQLRFETDSKTLQLSGTIRPGSSRKYYAFDVFVNGTKRQKTQKHTEFFRYIIQISDCKTDNIADKLCAVVVFVDIFKISKAYKVILDFTLVISFTGDFLLFLGGCTLSPAKLE